MKSGFVAIVGKANAGKSTLLNKLIGEKVAIVSPKPQTTRENILGILHEDDYQIVFVDTPGIHNPKNNLSSFMMKSVESATKDVSTIIVMIDSTKGISQSDINLILKHNQNGSPIICVLSKVDLIAKDRLLPQIAKLSEFSFIKAIVPISSRKDVNVDVLIDEVKKLLTDSVPFFPEEMITDKSQKYMVAEIIRERVLYNYNEEIPHGVGISINKFELMQGKDIYDIDADIVCEKQSHKPILIGKQGSALKQIGIKAREGLEKFLEKKVFLTLWVRVKEDWRNKENMLRELGYDSKEIE